MSNDALLFIIVGVSVAIFLFVWPLIPLLEERRRGNLLRFAPAPKRRGLYYAPEGGEVYATHQEWAGAQRPSTEGFAAFSLVTLNPAVHRCRIGKITLKQANG